MKTLTFSIAMFLACSFAAFSQESQKRPLLIHDFIGTYRLDRIENSWLADDVRERINEELIPSHDIFVIGDDYYILGGFREETVFFVSKIEGRAGERYIPKSRDYLSEMMGIFLDIPRLFDSAFECGGGIWVIEPFDYDTVVIHLRNSYLLYRRVK